MSTTSIQTPFLDLKAFPEGHEQWDALFDRTARESQRLIDEALRAAIDEGFRGYLVVGQPVFESGADGILRMRRSFQRLPFEAMKDGVLEGAGTGTAYVIDDEAVARWRAAHAERSTP